MVSHDEILLSVSMDELQLFLKVRWCLSMGISEIYEKILQFSWNQMNLVLVIRKELFTRVKLPDETEIEAQLQR